MSIDTDIKYASLDDLLLDPKNPRLGRRNTDRGLSQDQILGLISSWALEELAVSFLQNGFWPQEALIVVNDPEVDIDKLVVAEGNRRLAALKLLKLATDGRPKNKRWEELAKATPPKDLFEQIPTIRASDRREIDTYLGFRHVTGIKEWAPAEKAEYIAHLIDNGMSYVDVMRAIGSKTPTVRQNYITYKLFLQLEDIEDIDIETVEARFSVLFLSIREAGVQSFLGIDPRAEPDAARRPLQEDYFDNAQKFVTWVFGTNDSDPLFTDSRQMGRFAKVLENDDAVDYLKNARRPTLAAAIERAGTDNEELLTRLRAATDELELALSTAHLFAADEDVRSAVERLTRGFHALLNSFPQARQELFGLLDQD